MSDGRIKIEVNGLQLEARPGQMLIEVTDSADIFVPRFCYHEKLSIAANCRMCLVEVENAPKPLPACATPVTEGMKVFTKSPRAISAQKAIMEFLLINHPLDCPICDQGGECELQDLAMGYGRGISRFTERKRVIKDQDLGPLVSTDMTRCIQCTRCVRFGQEIAGIQELGTMGRGEFMEISTYVERSVTHELSGNIIDLCPVGALNNKPYRFSARAWELEQHATIAPHDCLGSNIYAHVLRGRLKRVVPHDNESVNETWISDRDRFSYEGIYSSDRLEQPMVREDGQWRACSWKDALELAASRLRESAATGTDSGLGAWISPSATLEEAYLASKLLRHLGSENIDHRLRQRDFGSQSADPLYPSLGVSIADVEALDAALVIGSNLRKEVPLLAHRMRKAALAGARLSFLNPAAYEFLFPVRQALIVPPVEMVRELVALLTAAGAELPSGVESLPGGPVKVSAGHQDIVACLQQGKSALVLLGLIASRHPSFGLLRGLADRLANATGARLGCLTDGANSAGASLAGALPHRGAGGEALQHSGGTVADMIAQPPRALMLLGVEPEHDCADPEAATAAVAAAEFVVALTPYFSGSIRAHADLVLPVGSFAETSGTYVNTEGRWQSFSGAAVTVGEARPAWKVLRVLGNLCDLPDCEYVSSTEIRDELKGITGTPVPDNTLAGTPTLSIVESGPVSAQELDVPIYQVDGLVRRAVSLQMTQDGCAGRGSEPELRETA